MKIIEATKPKHLSGQCDGQTYSAGRGRSESAEFVTIICKNNETLRCSRVRLASFSDYFRALFFGHFRENSEGSVNLEYFDAFTINQLLTFYEKYESTNDKYDTHPQICRIFVKDSESAWNLIRTADMLWMERAAAECDKYIIQTMTPKNYPEVCSLALQFSRFCIIKEAVRKWMVSQQISTYIFNEESATADLGTPETLALKLPETCAKCLACAEIGCMCEFIELFSAKHTIYVIEGYYWEQFRDCCCISAEKLLETARSEALSCGPGDSNNLFTEIQCYPGAHNEECNIVVLGTDIYATGGYDDKAKAIKENWKYETRTGSWKRVSDMRHERFYHCGFVVGEYLYVCGGFDDNFVLDDLERYDPLYNEWVELPKMLKGVGSAAHASDDSGLYVICGQYGYKEIQTSNEIQHYAISSEQWTLLTTYESPVFFPHSEYALSGAIMKEKLYVVGGQTERCDVYDLKTAEWKRIADMSSRRMEAGVLCLQNRLYICGGYDYRAGDHHDTIEEYNPEEDSWKLLSCRLPRPSRSVGFCHVFDVEKKS